MRLILLQTLIIMIISLGALIINLSQPAVLDSLQTTFTDTTITSLFNAQSDLIWYPVLVSGLVPVLLYVSIKYHFERVGCPPLSSERSRTIVVPRVDPAKHNSQSIMSWMRKHYPAYTCTQIEWARGSPKLHTLYRDYKLYSDCIEEFRGDPLGNRDALKEYETKQLTVMRRFQEYATEAREDPLSMVFISFETHQQARRFMMIESVDYQSDFGTGQLAPLPDGIIWENMRSPALTVFYNIAFNTLILAHLAFFTTPTTVSTYIKQIAAAFNVELNGWFFDIVPSLLFSFFSVLIKVLVKYCIIDYGGWRREHVIPKYISRLFGWSFLGVVVLPGMAISSPTNIIKFVEVALKPVLGMFEQDPGLYAAREIKENLNCLFLPDSGAFFINYLLISAGFRNLLQLHRLSNYLFVIWGYCTHRYSAVRRVAVEQIIEKQSLVSGDDSTSLMDSYAWVLIHFSIMLTFCISHPLITPAFLVYMISKYVSDVECYRMYYYTKGSYPSLVRTAITINLFCGMLPQITTLIYLIGKEELQSSNPRSVCSLLVTAMVLLFLIMESSGWRFPFNIFHSNKTQRPFSKDPANQYTDKLLTLKLKST